MSFYVGMFCIIDSFQKTAFGDRFTAIADVRNTESCSTDFKNKIGAVLIARGTKLAIDCCLPCTFFAAHVLTSAVEPILTGIVRVTRISRGDFGAVLPNLSGNGGWVSTQSAADFFKRKAFF
jgi:hypothetical protein